MLEESISCSPGNNGKKSRSRRFHKNAKKKCEQHNETTITTSDSILPNKLSSLEALYEESNHSGIINTRTQFEYFSPFENEKLLAAADRAEASTSSSKLQNLTSKGFVRLESLQFKEEHKILPMKPPERPPPCHTAATPRSPYVQGPETQFGITESEFVRFCDDAESDVLVQMSSDVKNRTIPDAILQDFNVSKTEGEVGTNKIRKVKSIVEQILTDFCGSPTESEIEEQEPNSPPKNIKGTKSIVDEILEDFCGSPYGESSPNINADDSTPIFRFKSQPIRTYSGLRKKKLFSRNIATDLNAFKFKDDGNTSDSSSGLSVQEDLSQSVVPQLDTVDLNNSVRLCENLLNLSSYFSQLTPSSSKERSPPSIVDESKDQRLSAIIEQIIKIKSKPVRINWNKIEEEFKGFSDYESDSKESTLQELLEDEDDVLQQINCDYLCYKKVEPKDSFSRFDRDLENTLQNASAVIEKAKALIFSESDEKQKENNSRNKFQPDCDINKDTESKPLLNSPLKDEQLFDEIDIWNDSECLLNYKTQKIHPKRVKHEDNDLLNDDLGENRAIYSGKGGEIRNSTIQKSKRDTKAELLKLSYCNNWESFKDPQQNLRDPCSSVSLKLSKTSRNNEIRQINAIDGFPDAGINFSIEKNAANENLPDNKFFYKLPTSDFVGFATVSKKPILVSDIARQKADEFLKKFEQQEFEEKISLDKNEFSNEIGTNKAMCNVSTIPLTDYQDDTNLSPASSYRKLSTTSKNTISLSSKQKEGEIMKNNVKKQPQCDTSSADARPNDSLNNNCSVGFSTASKKIISISNEAKQKADDILRKFEQNEQEKRMLDTTFDAPEKNIEDNLAVCGFIGFSTAANKSIAISVEAKRKADEILKKFEQAEHISEDKTDMAIEKLTQRCPNEVSEEVQRKAHDLLLDIEFFEDAFDDELKKIEGGPASPIQDEKRRAENTDISSSAKVFTQPTKEIVVEGFKTASRKSIYVSEEASRRADTFFKAVCDEDLPPEFLKCIESDINDANINGKNPVNNLMGVVEQVDGAIKSPNHHLHGVSKTESEHMHATSGLKIINNCPFYASERLSEQKKNCIKDEHIHSRQYDRIENIKYRKRKHSEGHELEKSSSLVTPRRVSCGERTPLNRIENGLLCKSSSLPLKECNPNSTSISRKNLLSLSKRRKCDSPGQIVESKSGPKTPAKEHYSSISHCYANTTPNLKEFFESVSTSTPRLIRNDQTNRYNQNSSKYTIDSDFQPIQWEDSNNSFRINRTSCVDDVNVTFSEVSPSPKQRIERLKMYGEPPPISPILMINKCRASGLRRGRSLMKP